MKFKPAITSRWIFLTVPIILVAVSLAHAGDMSVEILVGDRYTHEEILHSVVYSDEGVRIRTEPAAVMNRLMIGLRVVNQLASGVRIFGDLGYQQGKAEWSQVMGGTGIDPDTQQALVPVDAAMTWDHRGFYLGVGAGYKRFDLSIRTYRDYADVTIEGTWDLQSRSTTPPAHRNTFAVLLETKILDFLRLGAEYAHSEIDIRTIWTTKPGVHLDSLLRYPYLHIEDDAGGVFSINFVVDLLGLGRRAKLFFE